jgi:hypothetical protein
MIMATWTTFSTSFLSLEFIYLVNKKTFNEKSNLAKILL